MDWPHDQTPLFINCTSRFMAGHDLRANNAAFTTGVGAWGTANLALYIPIHLPFPYELRRMFWVNGSAAGGNWDIGIYNSDGKRLYSAGSTAGSGNSIPQYVTLGTPIILKPDNYYLGINHSAVTANQIITSTTTAPTARLAGLLQEALGSVALPASMTGVAVTTTIYPLCGFTRTPSGF